MFFWQIKSYFLGSKQFFSANFSHWLGALGPTVQELWPFKVGQVTKNAPLGLFFKKIIPKIRFFFCATSGISPRDIPLPDSYAIGWYFSSIFTKNDQNGPKKGQKKTKIGYGDTCRLIIPKLLQQSASNWLSNQPQGTSLSTINDGLLASLIMRQIRL